MVVKPGKPIRSLLASPRLLSMSLVPSMQRWTRYGPCSWEVHSPVKGALQGKQGKRKSGHWERRQRILKHQNWGVLGRQQLQTWLHHRGSLGGLLELKISKHSISSSIDMQLGPGIVHLTMIPRDSTELVHRPGECNQHQSIAFTLQVEQRGRKGTWRARGHTRVNT